MIEFQCDVCGETWVDSGEIVCPFCGSEEISEVVDEPDIVALMLEDMEERNGQG